MLAEQSPVILGQSPPPSLGPQSPSGPDVPAVAVGTPAVQAPGLPPPASPARLCLESIACPASFPSLEPGLWFLDPHTRLCPRALCPPRWIHALKTHRPGWTLGISTYLSLHGRTRPVPRLVGIIRITNGSSEPMALVCLSGHQVIVCRPA